MDEDKGLEIDNTNIEESVSIPEVAEVVPVVEAEPIAERKYIFKISAVMIVKDEAYSVDEDLTCIERCLDSIQDKVDEIIIVDTGSTDDTKAKCSQYEKVKLFDSENYSGDNFVFDGARRESISKATGDYVFVVDADEELVGDKNVLRNLIYDNPESAFYFKCVDVFNATDRTETDTNTRLFKPDQAKISGEVHNFISMRLDVPIVKYNENLFLHYGYQKTEKRKARNKQSKELLLKAIANEENVNSARSYYNFQLGIISYGENDYQLAKKYFKTAIRMYDQNEDILISQMLRKERETTDEKVGVLIHQKAQMGYVPIQTVAWLHQIACIEGKDFEREIYTRKIRKYIKHFCDIYFFNAQALFQQKKYVEAKKQLELYIKYYGYERPQHLISYSASRLNDAVVMLFTCIENI